MAALDKTTEALTRSVEEIKRLQALVNLLTDSMNPDECRIVSHTYCVVHGCLVVETPCPHAVAKAILPDDIGEREPVDFNQWMEEKKTERENDDNI